MKVWGEWDDITTLVNCQSIHNYLIMFWESMRQIDNPIVGTVHFSLEITSS